MISYMEMVRVLDHVELLGFDVAWMRKVTRVGFWFVGGGQVTAAPSSPLNRATGCSCAGPEFSPSLLGFVHRPAGDDVGCRLSDDREDAPRPFHPSQERDAAHPLRKGVGSGALYSDWPGAFRAGAHLGPAGNARMLNSVVLSAPHSLPQGLYISMLFWLFIMLVMGLFETSAASLEVVRGFIGFPSVSLLFYLPISLFCPCIYNRQPVGGGRICVSMALTLAMLRRELAVCRCARDR